MNVTHSTSAKPQLRFASFTTNWYSRRLSSVGTKYTGLSGKSGSDFGSGQAYITYMQIFSSSVINDKFGSVQILPGERQNRVQSGDIFFTTSSETPEETGFVSVLLKDHDELYLNSFCFGYRPDQTKLLPNFARYLFHSPNVRRKITRLSQGSTRYNISKTAVMQLAIPMPGVQEQQEIATLMSLVEDRVVALQQKLENLRAYRRSIAQQLFSQKLRFVRKDGSGYPDWEPKKLGDVLIERRQYTSKGGSYEHISLTTKGVVPKSERYERDFLVQGDDKQYRITKLDDICYNPANLKFGVIARNRYKDGIFSPIYVTYEVQHANTSFIEYMVTRKDFINRARKYEQGTVYERMAVGPKDFVKLNVLLPCQEEQQKIADYIEKIDIKIQRIISKYDAAKQVKTALLQRMFV